MLSGIISFVAVMAFGFFLWNSNALGDESRAAGGFILVLIGLPAFGFLVLTILIGSAFLVFGRKSVRDDAASVERLQTAKRRSATSRSMI